MNSEHIRPWKKKALGEIMLAACRDMEPQLEIRRFAMHHLVMLSFALVYDVPTYLVDLTNPKVSE